jgi:hypothetical protein
MFVDGSTTPGKTILMNSPAFCFTGMTEVSFIKFNEHASNLLQFATKTLNN